MGSVIFKRPPLRRFRKQGSDLFGVDMHFHTRYSMDGVSRITNMVKKAKKKDIGFAVTDHNEIKGVISAFKNRKGALVIPGIEVSCRDGTHILSYFYTKGELEQFFNKKIKPRLKKNPYRADISVSELINELKDYNSVICAPHPFAAGAVSLQKINPTKKLIKSLDLVEVINGYNFRRFNMKAVYWASSHNKAMCGGSDGHTTLELGKVLTFTKGTDIESIFKEMLKNRAVVIGKEEHLIFKMYMTARKETAYLRQSKKQKMAMKVLRSQLGSEYSNVKSKLKQGRMSPLLERHPFKDKSTSAAIQRKKRKLSK
jgi:predicted metal-dependent phosphoesterase TrpH